MEKINEWLDNPKRDYNEGVMLYEKHGKNRNLKTLFMRKHNSHTEKKLIYELHKLVGRSEELNKKQINNLKAKKSREAAKKAKAEAELKQSLISEAKEKFADVDFDDSKTVEELKQQIAELEQKTDNQQYQIEDLSDKVDEIGSKTSKRPHIVDNPEVDVKELPDNLAKMYYANKDMIKNRGIYHEKAKLAKTVEERKELIAKVAELDTAIADNWLVIDSWWQNRNKQPKELKKPVTQSEIDAWPNVEERVLYKDKRIKSNLNYIKRYANSEKQKQIKEVEVRKTELNAWEITYTIPEKGDK